MLGDDRCLIKAGCRCLQDEGTGVHALSLKPTPGVAATRRTQTLEKGSPG